MHNFATMHQALEIDLLRTFQAVVRFGQFLAAASYLNRSPSAVSVHIRRLESLVGGRLLERDNQTVTLTPLGRRFALQSSELLSVHDRVLASYTRVTAQGRVRLGISDEYADRLLLGLLGHLAVDYPDVELEVLTGSSGRLRESLNAGLLDLAMVVEPFNPDPAYPRPLQQLGSMEPVWVAALDYHPTPGQPVPLALHAVGCPYRSVGLDALARFDKPWRTVIVSASMTVLETAVCGGLAVGIVDRDRIGSRMRVLRPEEGFPSLPMHQIQLIGTPGPTTEAVQAVARLTGEHFRR